MAHKKVKVGLQKTGAENEILRIFSRRTCSVTGTPSIP